MKKLIVLLVAVLVSYPVLSLAADGKPEGGGVDAAGTTVKSGKSNSDNRVNAGAADAGAKVKSGKSNSSDRGSGVDAATTVKSGKSNTSE